MMAEAKQRKRAKPQLKVVFDTNVLYTGSASDLVRQEAAKLIKDSKFPDLEIQWYLPEIVRHERQYQMQRKALEMLPTIARLEKLLGHNLAYTNEILLERVEKAVTNGHEDLGLLMLALDQATVDWKRVALDSVYRRPPFKDGETEKGFRDCLVLESFLQLVNGSPKTPKVCRIVLVTGDKLVLEAAQTRTSGAINTSVVSNLDELKGLINTLVSQVDETFLSLLRPKAARLFFLPKDESTLFYKEGIREQLEAKFGTELSSPPSGVTNRTNGTWRISSPNFERKSGRRVHWASRIEIEAEASRTTAQLPSSGSLFQSNLEGNTVSIRSMGVQPTGILGMNSITGAGIGNLIDLSQLGKESAKIEWQNLGYAGSPVTTVTFKGLDIYEVLWGADVTTSRELRRASIDDIKYVGVTWEQTA